MDVDLAVLDAVIVMAVIVVIAAMIQSHIHHSGSSSTSPFKLENRTT